MKDENWVWTLGMECYNFQEKRTYTLSTELQFLSSHIFHKTWVKDDRCYGLLQIDCYETVLMTWDLAAETVLSSVVLQITGADLHFNFCSQDISVNVDSGYFFINGLGKLLKISFDCLNHISF